MKKRWLMALALLVCLCLLTACKTSEPDKYQVKTQTSGQQQTAGATGSTGNKVLVGDEYMDPLAEEDYNNFDDSDWMEELPTAEPPTPTPALVFRGEYAGATPVPIDPIDKPTPTAVPPLAAFSFKTYEATLTLHAEKVKSQYSTSDLKTVVRNMLSAIEAQDVVVEFSPTNTASRDLLEADGVYADYTATLAGGVRIRGRVHATCVEKVLYTVHLSAPADYWDLTGDGDYKDGVYDKMRHTIRITK